MVATKGDVSDYSGSYHCPSVSSWQTQITDDPTVPRFGHMQVSNSSFVTLRLFNSVHSPLVISIEPNRVSVPIHPFFMQREVTQRFTRQLPFQLYAPLWRFRGPVYWDVLRTRSSFQMEFAVHDFPLLMVRGSSCSKTCLDQSLLDDRNQHGERGV